MESKGAQGTCPKKPGSLVIATKEGPAKENKCLGQKLQFYPKACSGGVRAARRHMRPASSRCLHPAHSERHCPPTSRAWFPFAYAPLCSPSHTRAEIHLGLTSSGPLKHAGRAWITPCPIHDSCLLLTMLFCKHKLQQLIFHCCSNQRSLGRKEGTGGQSIQKYPGTPHLLVWLKQWLLLLQS